jgi:molecular chaperone DnaK
VSELIVGIDLGTTNSEVAAFVDGKVEVLGPGSKMLPSCVGFTPAGELLIGQPAKNQQLLYPERTIRSIKRKMGSSDVVMLNNQKFTPAEISAFILRELAGWAAKQLGQPATKAVITVPAYFSDAQRNATREAGALAGLEVVRILNEPTAASLAYGFGDGQRHTAMVYDLGGGTFDVSIVTVEGEITEVLASHGNNQLGGDDFDELLLQRLEREFQERHGMDLRQHPAAHVRLRWAAEEAKKKLSFEPYATVREEALVTKEGTPLHLDVEISRTEYEAMIRPLIESTLVSVSRALTDAGKTPRDVDAILLVGGSTRTPMVSRLLKERTHLDPRQDIHPDLCVALGAGVLASHIAGRNVGRVLVDVSPFSFGPSYLDERGGVPYPHCYHPLIERNTPLPVTRSDSYYTASPFQTAVQIEIYQGEDDDALKNILVGEFRVEGLQASAEGTEVLCRMSLDLDGILHVSAIEKATGKAKHITIANATKEKTDAEIAAARERSKALYSGRTAEWEGASGDDFAEEGYGSELEVVGNVVPIRTNGEARADDPMFQAARELVDRSRVLLERMHADDVEEAVALHEKIDDAIAAHNAQELKAAVESLKELLFFVEGK